MSKPFRIFSVAFLLVSLFSYSYPQKPAMKWGPELKVSRNEVILEVLGNYGGKLLVLRGKGKMFNRYLEDYNIQRINTKNLTPGDRDFVNVVAEGDDLPIEFAFRMGERVYLFGGTKTSRNDRKDLYVQELDGITLDRSGPPRQVAFADVRNKRANGLFGYSISRDSSHILIYSNSQSRGNEAERYQFNVFDADMRPIWSKSVRLDVEERLFVVEDYTVDGSGNVYLLAREYKEKVREKRKGKPNYKYVILAYTKDGERVEEFEISLKDRFLTDMRIDVGPENNILCAGFYSEKGTFSIKGSFFLKVGKGSGSILHESFKEFDLDFVTQFFRARQEKKAKKKAKKGKQPEMYEYDLRRIIPRSDGGAVLIGEQFYIRVVTYTDPTTRTTRTTYYYHYNDIIVVGISPSGDIEWASKIPKRQVSQNDGGYYSSFATMVTRDKLFFVYNDHEANLGDVSDGKIKNFNLGDRKGVVVLASVDGDGKVIRKALLDNTEIETITRPKLCMQISPEEMVMFGVRGKKQQFGLLKF